MTALSQRVQGQLPGSGRGGAEPPEPGTEAGWKTIRTKIPPGTRAGCTRCTQALTSAAPGSPHGTQGLILAQPQGLQPKTACQRVQGWPGLLWGYSGRGRIGKTTSASSSPVPCGSPDGSPMAWQMVLLSIEGQVKGCSHKGRRPSSLDRVCISLNRGRGRRPYWEGKGWLGCPKAKEAES